MKKRMDKAEREKRHQTVVDSFIETESEAILQVRAGDVWTDFIRVPPEKREDEVSPRQDGGVPLIDEMTGIRQWE
jgi:hypothetical protein